MAKIAARDVASSKDAKEAGQKIWTIWTAMDTSRSPCLAALGREGGEREGGGGSCIR